MSVTLDTANDDTHALEAEAGQRFLALPARHRTDLVRRLEDECRRRGFTYERDGRADVIPMGLVPVVMTQAQAAELHALAISVRRVLSRLPDLWLADSRVRQLLPLDAAEEQWLRDTWTPRHHEAQAIVSRLDADIRFGRPVAGSAQFFEYNGVACGGLYYAAAAEAICEEVVAPALGLKGLGRGPAIPRMMAGEIRRQGRALGVEPRRVAILENRDWDSGITEAPQFARIFGEMGLETVIADPRDLELSGGEFRLRGVPYDFLYRHMEIRDLVELELGGARLDAVRQAFRLNRAVSSMSGEFDHKACWEVAADPRCALAFPAGDLARIQAHLPWTRVVREESVRLPDGREGDLIEFMRRHRERCVLKPNRECGGEGVTIGLRETESAWDGRLATALSESGRWVAQSFIPNAVKRFPVANGDGEFSMAERYVAYGFAATEDGLGCLGRFSADRVVNVSMGGGIMPVMRVGSPGS